MASANNTQVGGQHYKTGGLEHWDYMDIYSIPYLEGIFSGYLLRWRRKNGREDLDKAIHCLEKIIERTPSGRKRSGRMPSAEILTMSRGFDVSQTEVSILENVLAKRNLTSFLLALEQLKAFRNMHPAGS